MIKKNKINKKQFSVSERQFGVVLENIYSKLDLVVEGHKRLDKKIDGVDKKVDVLKTEMDYKFGVVFEKFDEVGAQFKHMDEQFSDVKDELHIIRNELKEKIGRDEFVLLEKRVMALEKSKK